ncbi:hypothetical protein AAMO2058_001581600 [Amorphochlora amoebiformis]
MTSKINDLKATLRELEGIKAAIDDAQVNSKARELRKALECFESETKQDSVAASSIPYIATYLGVAMNETDVKNCLIDIGVQREGYVDFETFEKWWGNKEITEKSYLDAFLLHAFLRIESAVRKIGEASTCLKPSSKSDPPDINLRLKVSTPEKFEKKNNHSLLHVSLQKSNPPKEILKDLDRLAGPNVIRLPLTGIIKVALNPGTDAKLAQTACESFIERHLAVAKERLRFQVRAEEGLIRVYISICCRKDQGNLVDLLTQGTTLIEQMISHLSVKVDMEKNLADALTSTKCMDPLISLLNMNLDAHIKCIKMLPVVLVKALGLNWGTVTLASLNKAQIELSFGQLSEILDVQSIKPFMESLPAMVRLAALQAKQPALVIGNILKAVYPAFKNTQPKQVQDILGIIEKHFASLHSVELRADTGLGVIAVQRGILEGKIVPKSTPT